MTLYPLNSGRYDVVRFLGRGAFGCVYLARDRELNRDVAIKVPDPQSLATPGRLQSMLAEARSAAALKHPGIVGVYDIVRESPSVVFIVFEYVEGMTLLDLLRRGPLDPARLARLICDVAEATHCAHRAGLVHRDLKPANIIIDQDGTPRVADFGLALSEEEQPYRAGEVAGTPNYMAPEQVRGEAHRLDGRTDIWALGVILYHALTRRPPFVSRNRAELFDEILRREPKPPRQIDDTVPRELERICLKCLSKRMTDRYETALDLADDLRLWLAEAGTPALSIAPSVRVVPKGLRSFDETDADFFLSLLPGPRGRGGLPESVRFWKTRIEDRSDDAFRVGLLYGPSGGGKSSLVRAGLLPRLDRSIRTIYVECSRDWTESRLLGSLQRSNLGIPASCGLVEAFAMLRDGRVTLPDMKVLIVLDQFEQWLHAHPSDDRAELVNALRHCDGRRVQAMLLIRDDFWLTITRFFRAIEVPLLEGVNSTPVELFDEAHAHHVLEKFGRACGRIPEEAVEPGIEATRFIEQAVREMCGADGRVTPVRLSLFSEVVRSRPWSLLTLRDLGGVAGIGVTFLIETFDTPSSPPSHRVHQKACQSVLLALLPAANSVLRGQLRSVSELLDASSYRDRPAEFAEVIQILDIELRMITPVDRDAAEEVSAGSPGNVGETHYQLAHEFLITPIRQWIERKLRASRSGRARIRLGTITASWCDRPGPQRVASPLEWIGILWHVPARTWSADESRMMRSATRHHLGRACAAVLLIGATATAIQYLRQADRDVAAFQRTIHSDYRSLRDEYPELATHGRRYFQALENLERDPSAAPRERQVATLLLYRDQPTTTRAQALRGRLVEAGPDEVALIRDVFAARPEQAGIDALVNQVLDDSTPAPARLRAACVLTPFRGFSSKADFCRRTTRRSSPRGGPPDRVRLAGVTRSARSFPGSDPGPGLCRPDPRAQLPSHGRRSPDGGASSRRRSRAACPFVRPRQAGGRARSPP